MKWNKDEPAPSDHTSLFMNYLYQLGYLAPSSKNSDMCHIPNLEIKAEFNERLIDYYIRHNKVREQSIEACVKILNKILDGDQTRVEDFKEALNQLFEHYVFGSLTTPARFKNRQREALFKKQQEEMNKCLLEKRAFVHPNKAFCQAVICAIAMDSKHLVFGSEVGSEAKKGRADVIVIGPKTSIIIELKWDKSGDDALEQATDPFRDYESILKVCNFTPTTLFLGLNVNPMHSDPAQRVELESRSEPNTFYLAEDDDSALDTSRLVSSFGSIRIVADSTGINSCGKSDQASTTEILTEDLLNSPQSVVQPEPASRAKNEVQLASSSLYGQRETSPLPSTTNLVNAANQSRGQQGPPLNQLSDLSKPKKKSLFSKLFTKKEPKQPHIYTDEEKQILKEQFQELDGNARSAYEHVLDPYHNPNAFFPTDPNKYTCDVSTVQEGPKDDWIVVHPVGSRQSSMAASTTTFTNLTPNTPQSSTQPSSSSHAPSPSSRPSSQPTKVAQAAYRHLCLNLPP
uniref:Uncharacterized protein n=1 Tax=Ditylenchus dipsaci TaxID=166011 RepID=A0A915E0M3_9BILA